MAGDARPEPERTLRSWKEIASFFGRDERTVKRWETQRGLPVHRLPGRTHASIYAYPSELETWLKGDRTDAAPADPGPTFAPEPAPAPVRPDRRRRMILLAGGAGLAAALAGVYVSVAGMPLHRIPLHDGSPGETLSSDAAARDQYLAGMYQLDLRTKAGLTRAAQHFTEAIAHDPAFAAAYAGLSKAYNLLSQYTLMPPEQAYPLAKAAAERALALDPQLPAAYASLGLTEFYWSRDFARSRQLFEKSLQLDPNSAETNHWYALVMMQMGRFEVAVRSIQRAQELNPQARSILANKALILYHAGDLDGAETILRQFVDSAPDYVAPHFYLADLYFDQKRYGESLHHALEAARIQDNASALAILGAAEAGYRAGGARGLLEAQLKEQKNQHAKGAEPAYKIARTLAFLGQTDAALDYLATAVAAREPDALGIGIDAAFKGMAGDRRFSALVAKVGYDAPTSGPAVAIASDEIRTGTAERR